LYTQLIIPIANEEKLVKSIGALTVFSIIVATAYGVLFSIAYPLVKIDGNLIALFAILGVATCMAIAGIWKLIKRTSP
jgi:hypothetical protein